MLRGAKREGSCEKLFTALAFLMDRRGRLGARLGRIRSVAVPAEKRKKVSSVSLDPDKKISGWERAGEYVMRKLTEIPAGIPELPDFPSFFLDTPGEQKHLTFYDIETTGLSGGAGTLIFLAGFGTFLEGKLFIDQLFLTDFPGEKDFLHAVSERISETDLRVSYNGKTFDRPLLRSRFLFHGIPFPEGREIDLLHPSRACFSGKISSCSLAEMERSVLNITRGDDVPGHMVPEIYFSWLRTGKADGLDLVFAHHVQDIASLAALFHYFETAYQRPLSLDPETRSRLGIYLLRRNREEGADLLRSAWEEGEHRAGKILSLFYKHRREFKHAVNIWRTLWEKRHSGFEGMELAKYYEHQEKNYSAALSIVEELLKIDCKNELPIVVNTRNELTHRKNRLLKRNSRQ